MMIREYSEESQSTIEKEALEHCRSRELLGAVERADYVRLEKLTRSDEAEFLHLLIEPEVPSKPSFPILPREPVAVAVVGDEELPEALALRPDFPPDVPHLNLRPFEYPFSLCLDQEEPSTQRLRWRAAAFLTRIRDWLSLTAKGELHQDDQPLERILPLSPAGLVIPFDVYSGQISEPSPLRVGATRSPMLLKAEFADEAEYEREQVGVLITVMASARIHGGLRKLPFNLLDLCNEFAEKDFRQSLQEGVAKAVEVNRDANVYLLTLIPKKRSTESGVESWERGAFLLKRSALEVAEALDLGVMRDGEYARHLFSEPQPKDEELKSVDVVPLNPISTLTPKAARSMSGRSQHLPSCTVLGAGALGSQLLLNLARGGQFEDLRIVDKDHLLPHNFVRHAAMRADGWMKSELMANWVRELFDPSINVTQLEEDILEAAEEDCLAEDCQLILDCSANIAVARTISDDWSADARRVSCFLNPTGTDSVLLAEAAERGIRLGELEMEYYQLVASHPDLTSHINSQEVQRYGLGCRDVSSQVPQDLVGTHAGILAREVSRAQKKGDPQVSVWIASDTNEVRRVDAAPSAWLRISDIDTKWDIRIRMSALQAAFGYRQEKLPSETGGIIIGSHDMQRSIVYVTDFWNAPLDSIEAPYGFLRGTRGLQERLNTFQEQTAGWLDYVGEWHSHPDGAGCSLSEDDQTQRRWLDERLRPSGFPTIMFVLCQDEQVRLVVNDESELFSL